MEEIRLTAELKKNCETNVEKLFELLKEYDLCVLGEEVQEKRINEIYNRVLKENTFKVSKDYSGYRDCPKPGERITDEKLDFLMSDEDYEKFLGIALPLLVEAGLTDNEYRYRINWSYFRMEAKTDLVNFIIDKILPTEMRKIISPYRFNVVQQDKLIDIMRKVV